MRTISAKKYVGTGFPPEEGARLAEALLKEKVNFEGLTIDLEPLAASLIISAFFNGFLQRVHTERPDLLSLARLVRWSLKFDFQRENVARWMKDFKPYTASEHRA